MSFIKHICSLLYFGNVYSIKNDLQSHLQPEILISYILRLSYLFVLSFCSMSESKRNNSKTKLKQNLSNGQSRNISSNIANNEEQGQQMQRQTVIVQVDVENGFRNSQYQDDDEKSSKVVSTVRTSTVTDAEQMQNINMETDHSNTEGLKENGSSRISSTEKLHLAVDESGKAGKNQTVNEAQAPEPAELSSIGDRNETQVTQAEEEDDEDETNLSSFSTPPEYPEEESATQMLATAVVHNPSSSSPKLSRSSSSYLSVASSSRPSPSPSRSLRKNGIKHNYETDEDADAIISSILQENNSRIDPSKLWLYKSDNNNKSKYPDIILNLIEDNNSKGKPYMRPVLRPSELKLLRDEENPFPDQEIQVYIEQDEESYKRNARRSSGSPNPSQQVTDLPRRSLMERRTTAMKTSDVPNPPPTIAIHFNEDYDTRCARLRRLSSVSRVLIVDEDNQFEDILELEIDALGRRLARDNYGAIKLLSYIGDELDDIESGDQTPVGYEYSDNVLKRRFLISWKAAAADARHKKTEQDTDIPLGATKIYTRSISIWRRFFRLLRLYCICCLGVFRMRRRRNTEDMDDYFYERNIITVESIEQFQQELDVMENMYRFRRISHKRGSVLGATKSIREFQTHLNDKKRSSNNNKQKQMGLKKDPVGS